jgi:hypothetical protein
VITSELIHVVLVGTVALEDNEYKSMNLDTAMEPSTGFRFVIPQVFHNLHCLVRTYFHVNLCLGS